MLRSPSTVLYAYRNALSVALFLTAVYFALYTKTSVPPLVLFLGWQPDTKLIVLANIPEEYRRFV